MSSRSSRSCTKLQAAPGLTCWKAIRFAKVALDASVKLARCNYAASARHPADKSARLARIKGRLHSSAFALAAAKRHVADIEGGAACERGQPDRGTAVTTFAFEGHRSGRGK